MTRWYEDIALDEPFPLGSHTFTADEIVRFGKAYDPQYFHVDPEAAKHSHFGGLIASGWHTACMGHRKMVDALSAERDRLVDLGEQPGIAGPGLGVNSMVFRTPVRPGDRVTYTLVVKGKRPSNSLPGWGLLFNTVTGRNQDEALVYEAEVVSMVKLRDFKMPLRLKLLQAVAGLPGWRRLVAR